MKICLKNSYSTRHATNSVFLPQSKTDQYGKFSIKYQAASTWNYLQNKLDINMLEELIYVTSKTYIKIMKKKEREEKNQFISMFV